MKENWWMLLIALLALSFAFYMPFKFAKDRHQRMLDDVSKIEKMVYGSNYTNNEYKFKCCCRCINIEGIKNGI